MNYQGLFSYYLIFCLVGLFLVYFHAKHRRKFLWREYLAFLSVPLLGLLGSVIVLGSEPVYVYIMGCFIGPVLEWLVGLFYHKVVGSYLWIYERYPLPGRYTSYLAAPIWGMAFIIIWLFARSMG